MFPSPTYRARRPEHTSQNVKIQDATPRFPRDLDEVLREAIFQDNTAQLNMRLPPAMKTMLNKLARQRTTDATTFARIWLVKRLERERKVG